VVYQKAQQADALEVWLILAYTHIYTPLAAAKLSCRPSHLNEPILGCLDTTQALVACVSKSTWGKVRTPQVELCRAAGNLAVHAFLLKSNKRNYSYVM